MRKNFLVLLVVFLVIVDHVEICKRMRSYRDVRKDYQTFIDIFDSLRSEGIYPVESHNDAVAEAVLGTCERNEL